MKRFRTNEFQQGLLLSKKTTEDTVKHLRLISLTSVVLALTGCVSGASHYSAPTAYKTNENTVVVARSRDAAWQAAIPKLSKEFFVINTIDKSSGIVNISYAGDPSKYIDCGRVHSEVKNVQGERVYDIAAASPIQQFEGTGWVGAFHSPRLTNIDRRVSLDGRMNIVFEDVDATHTRITVSSRYIVKRDTTMTIVPEGITQRSSDSVSFNTAGSASFPMPANSTGTATTCTANNQFEAQILDLVKS
ncbi:hypothetical protein VOM14_18675 [Paraburkholderia sp. MPAMCS5]|uniref:hypothetical protein n=1 Tax=Paraburkholderia sp. MPAMCS5 TaxID=3112563 RepID=UPI002E197BB5|nr:hypothetical protein [Paraburkholderia sp. MPAMCS5]